MSSRPASDPPPWPAICMRRSAMGSRSVRRGTMKFTVAAVHSIATSSRSRVANARSMPPYPWAGCTMWAM